MFIQQPFDEFLRFNYERVSDTSLKVILPIQPLFLNSAGVVHGGVISSLTDVAMCIRFTWLKKCQAVVTEIDLTE